MVEHQRDRRHPDPGGPGALGRGTAQCSRVHTVTAEALAQSEQEIERPVIEAPADRLDASRIPTTLVGLALVAHLVIYFAGSGTVTLNIVNWMFLGLIFLLSRNAFEVMGLVKNAASNVGTSCCGSPCTPGSWAS